MFQYFLLLFLVQNVNSARILAIISTASYSHQVFFQELWQELAVRAHDIVVVTTDPTGEKLPNFREISIREGYEPVRQYVEEFTKGNAFILMLQNKMIEMGLNLADFELALPQIQEILNNKTEHFDLVMVETFFPIWLTFKHRFNCPLIGVVSLDSFPILHEFMGNPVHSVLYPMFMFPFQENLTFLQRLIVVIVSNILELLHYISADKTNEIARKYFGKDAPHIDDTIASIDMLFVNANPVFNPVRPYTPGTINLAGGMHMKPLKPLPKELEDFVENAKEGVIYFSLGSNVRSNELSLEMRQTLIDTFADIPYKIVWKYEDDYLPGKPENVKVIKWAPQQDVLRHKNVKVFVTQGGIQSLEEALYSHVPVVVIPFVGDQPGNAEKIAAKGLGIILDRHNFNGKDFKSALLEVIENPKYRNHVKEWSDRIQDQPMKALDKAVWWTEYVLRHKGAKHLKGPRIPRYQYYYLDVLAFLGLVVVVAIGAIVCFIGKFLIRELPV